MTNEVRELFDFISTNGMSVLWDYGGSRAASTVEALPEVRVTELVNGVLVSKSLNKVTEIGQETSRREPESESGPEIIDLQEYAKSKAASSVQVNEVREIFEFLNGKF